MTKVYVLVLEYSSDGDISVEVVCVKSNKEDAQKAFEDQYNEIMQMEHWAKAVADDSVEIDKTDTSAFAEMMCDDYYFNLLLEEKIVDEL